MSSNQGLITTVSESVEEQAGPPEYNESLTSPIICSDGCKSDYPPSYDYLYNKKTYYTKVACETLKKIFTKRNCLIALIVIILTIQVLNIYVGEVYKNECPGEPNIPIWLMVSSIGIIFLIIDLILLVRFELRRNFFIGAFLAFLLLFWLVKGSIWVYSLNSKVDFFNPSSSAYCDFVCFNLAFWNVTTSWCYALMTIIYFTVFKKCKPRAENNNVVNP